MEEEKERRRRGGARPSKSERTMVPRNSASVQALLEVRRSDSSPLVLSTRDKNKLEKGRKRKAMKSRSAITLNAALERSNGEHERDEVKLQTNYLLLQDVLSDPIRLLFFRDWCRGEFCAESLDFWLAVEDHKANPDARRAKDIQLTWIDEDGKTPVTLSGPTRIELQSALSRLSKAITPPVSLFDAAQAEAFETIRTDPFPRFLRTVIYAGLQKTSPKSRKSPLPAVVYEDFATQCTASGPSTSPYSSCLTLYRWDHDDWEKLTVRYSKTRTIDVMRKRATVGSGFICVKSAIDLNGTPEELRQFLYTGNSAKQTWDADFHSAEVVDAVSSHVDIVYMLFKMPSFRCRNRDMVLFRSWSRLKGKNKGAIAIVLKSMTHSAKPEVKGVVRTECQISGYYLRPTSETQTRLYFYSNVDLRGNMEDKIAQSFAIQRAAQVDKMAARFAKWRAQE